MDAGQNSHAVQDICLRETVCRMVRVQKTLRAVNSLIFWRLIPRRVRSRNHSEQSEFGLEIEINHKSAFGRSERVVLPIELRRIAGRQWELIIGSRIISVMVGIDSIESLQR